MASQTGCLGFSLRTTVIVAGVITLLESSAWTALSIASVLTGQCFLSAPSNLGLSLRLVYILYFLNPECYSGDLSVLSPAGQQAPLTLTTDGDVATARRTAILSAALAVTSCLWIATSLLFLATVVGKLRGSAGARLCYPWIVVTAASMLIDLVATGFYASDAVDFVDVNRVAAISGVRIPETWLSQNADDASFQLKTAPLIVLAVTARGVVLWLLNGVLLVHAIRAVRAMFAEGKDKVKDVQAEAKRRTPSPQRAGSSPLPQTRSPTHEQPPTRSPTEHVPPTRPPPLRERTSLEKDSPPSGIRHRPTVDDVETVVPPSPTATSATTSSSAAAAAATPSPTLIPVDEPAPVPVAVAAPFHVPVGGVLLPGMGRPSGRPSRAPENRRSMSPPLPSTKHGDATAWQSADPDSDRLPPMQRVWQLRSSGRRQDGSPSPAIEAMINKLNTYGMESSASSVVSEPAANPYEDSRQFEQATSWEYHDDIFPGDDAFTHPYRDPRQYARQNSAGDYPHSGRSREFEDHRGRRLNRANSDRVGGGEWRMGQRPPGNLHGLSLSAHPASSPILDHGATEGLPWSYIHGGVQKQPGDQNWKKSPSKVVHNMFLPSGIESDSRQSPSSKTRRDKPFSTQELY